MFREFREFAMRGNVVDLAVGIHHRRGLWQNRDLPGQRHHHATHRAPARPGRFFQPVHQSLRTALRLAGRSQSRGRPDHQLRRVSQHA